jgi:hypothetical protein
MTYDLAEAWDPMCRPMLLMKLVTIRTPVSSEAIHVDPNALSRSIPFQVNLDSSVSMPIVLVDAASSSTLPKSALSRRGPPGKFYCGSYAAELLGTLRTKGSFSRATLSPEATEVDRLNFRYFMKRLVGEELVELFFRILFLPRSQYTFFLVSSTD